jgi:SHS family lactate transporter-like MFS transporter
MFVTVVVGTSYQLGNLISSASSTIEATIGERYPLPPKGKTKRYAYGKVICIFMACVFVYVIILTLIGPERLGRKFGVAHDSDMGEAIGQDPGAAIVHDREAMGNTGDRDSSEDEKVNGTVRGEKGSFA